MTPEFRPWPKIARLNRDIVITEKIDGTNAAIGIVEDCCDMPEGDHSTGLYLRNDGHLYQPAGVYAQSRTRIITPEKDNFGFAAWVKANEATLVEDLGPGLHFGEWWGKGIQRTYGLDERRFSLFNTAKWAAKNGYFLTPGVASVPVLHEGPRIENGIDMADRYIWWLQDFGSAAAPGFMQPEGIVVFHTAANAMFKVTLEGDEKPKGQALAELQEASSHK